MNRHVASRPVEFEECSQIIACDPESGALRWKSRDRSFFRSDKDWKSWNVLNENTEAFTAINGDGYKVGMILNRMYFGHRVIWLLHTGSWPNGEIDHINGDRADNRFSNLRDVPAAINALNKGIPANNTSGVLGVYFYKRTGKWQAQIKKAGVKSHLGFFDEFDAAVKARKDAEIRMGFHSNHGRPA